MSYDGCCKHGVYVHPNGDKPWLRCHMCAEATGKVVEYLTQPGVRAPNLEERLHTLERRLDEHISICRCGGERTSP